ncbi:hypothetical protein MAR_015880 [Mya arenaria]|uniref:Uncharacterized protein n=1 Tax=Mya arenaria TaxID=6604 RepID=A0ABY7FMD4_MYAAR|nr:hypothetical protein MAR_015880 [Mya arenaria]
MAKIVSTKVHRPVGNEIVPKDYSYRGQQPRPAPIPAYPQTRRYSETSPATIGDQIFKNLLQEANAKSLQGYGQGQYPVIPPVSAAQPYQYYTNQGLNAMQQQPPVQQQYERTIVRIVVRSGQTYVHATPDMVDGASPPQGNLEAEYVPVYLEEGEEFNYDKFMRQYQTGNYRAIGPGGGGNSPRRYGTPKQVPRSYPYNDYGDDRAYTTDIRPNTIDPMSHLRWQREGDRRSTAFTRH